MPTRFKQRISSGKHINRIRRVSFATELGAAGTLCHPSAPKVRNFESLMQASPLCLAGNCRNEEIPMSLFTPWTKRETDM